MASDEENDDTYAGKFSASWQNFAKGARGVSNADDRENADKMEMVSDILCQVMWSADSNWVAQFQWKCFR